MQWNDQITLNNVLRATEFILSLDKCAIIEPHQSNTCNYLHSLKVAYDNYCSHSQKDYWVLFAESARPIIFKNNLQILKHYTVKLAQILTPEFQNLLHTYLNNPEMPLPRPIFDDEHETYQSVGNNS